MAKFWGLLIPAFIHCFPLTIPRSLVFLPDNKRSEATVNQAVQQQRTDLWRPAARLSACPRMTAASPAKRNFIIMKTRIILPLCSLLWLLLAVPAGTVDYTLTVITQGSGSITTNPPAATY
jgi:hypothetical protein